MSVMSSIANMFRPTQQVTMAPSQQQQPMQQQNPGAAQLPAPGTSLPTNQQAEPSNPLDAFTPLWQNDPNAAPTADPLTTPLFNTDPAKIQEAAGKMDFLANVPKELIDKAMAGNDPGSFLQVMNMVAQRTLAAATQLSTATVEQGAQRSNQRVLQALPDRVKQIQLDQMQPENPALSHPAAQPFLHMARAQLKAKNPTLSAAEIQKQAERYVSDFASSLSVTPEAAAAQQTAGEDWDRFLN